jgi:hypothetical protein
MSTNDEAGEKEKEPCFHIHPDGRRAGLLVMTPKDTYSIAYGWYHSAVLNPSQTEIEVVFSNYDVKIVGERLFPVMNGLNTQQLDRIKVATRPESFSKRETIITRIDVTEVDQEGS